MGKVEVLKVVVIVFCVLLMLNAITFFAVGGHLIPVTKVYMVIFGKYFVILPIVMFVVGLAILILAVVGIFGARKERLIILLIFASCLLLFGAFEFVVGIVALVKRETFDPPSVEIIKEVTSSMLDYKTDSEVEYAWNTFQKEYTCCGTVNASDWLPVDAGYEDNGYPSTCCENTEDDCLITSPSFHHDGCLNKLGKQVAIFLLYVAIGAFVFGTFVGLTVVLSCFTAAALHGRKEALRKKLEDERDKSQVSARPVMPKGVMLRVERPEQNDGDKSKTSKSKVEKGKRGGKSARSGSERSKRKGGKSAKSGSEMSKGGKSAKSRSTAKKVSKSPRSKTGKK